MPRGKSTEVVRKGLGVHVGTKVYVLTQHMGFQPRQHSNPEKKAQRVVILMKMRTVQKI